MEAKAIHRTARISPQKARLVADQVRGLPVGRATNILTFSTKKAAQIVKKVLQSAIANAENNQGADIDELKVTQIFVDEGPTMFSLTSTGTCALPLCTAIVRPTISGRIIERRDQVLIGRLLLVATAVSTFFARCRSTKGPFLSERGMVD